MPEQPKSTTAPADPLTKPKKAKSTTALANPLKYPATVKSDSKLEQQQKVEKPTKSSKSDPRGSVWNRPNAKFKFGERFLSETELEKAGPRCVALHAWYMKECEEKRTTGMVAVFKKQHFWRLANIEFFVVGLEDLFDLYKLDGLDVGLLRVLSL